MLQVQATHHFDHSVVRAKDGTARKDKPRHPKISDAGVGAKTIQARADAVLKAFNTWAYKREQPSCTDRLRDVAVQAVTKGVPVPFVLYWGKGPRSAIAQPDLACLDYLAGMAARIRAAYEGGASIRLILTDTHARLNGHPASAVDAYFAAVAEAAAARGFDTVRLATLVEATGGRADPQAGAEPCGAVLDNLVACAAKWYRGEGSTEEGAIEYYRMNMVERYAVEQAYPESVFVTFNNAEFRELFPTSMPIFYMYSLKRGVGVKPWFMAADGALPGAAPMPLPNAAAVVDR